MSLQSPIIALRNASVRFRNDEQPTLQDLNLEVQPGEFVGIVGPTGCGKTTLLNLLAGVIPHYTPAEIDGEVLLFGKDTRELSFRKTTSQLGFVLQDPEAQLFNLIVRDEIVWGLENRGLARAEMSARLDEALEMFGISHLRNRVTYDLSGGQKQRVALASIYALKPAVIFLDNPTSQLDPVGAASVIEAINRLAATDRFTIVMVEDKVDELLENADRILMMDQGRIVLDATPRAFCEARELRARVGIQASQVAELSYAMGEAGVRVPTVPITLAEAAPVFQSLIGTLSSTQVPTIWEAPSKSDVHPVGTRDLANARGGTPGEPVLVAKQVEFTYPYPRMIRALQCLDLDFNPGEFVAVIGRNGSGKTTLAKCLSGYLKPTHGRVMVRGGQELGRLPPPQRVGHVGYVFQNPDHQLFKETVWEEVAFGLRNLRTPPEIIEERVTQVLTALDLESKRDLHPFRLSKGDRQRLAIASIAVLRPSALIVDEPTTGQDPVKAREVMNLLAQINREQQMCIIIISHAMDLVAEYARRTIVMADGEVILDGPTRTVFSQPEILARADIKPPPVTRLALSLGLVPAPVTLTEAQDLILSRVKA